MTSISVKVTNAMKNCLSLPYYQSHWNQAVISCSTKCCLVTAEDIVVFCLETPIENTASIFCEDFNNDCLILLKSDSHGCCVLSMKENKILDHFQNAKEVLVDDYINIGHDQVIFVFQGEDEEEDFYVTDYACCRFDTRKEKSCSSNVNAYEDITSSMHEETTGYVSAVVSLKNKLLSTTSLLHNENAKICEKEELIKMSISRLICQSIDVESDQSTSPCLINLLDENEYSSHIVSNTCSSVSPFIVHDIWHKICDKHIVISIEIENDSKEYFYNLSLRLDLNDSSLSSCSEIVFLNNFSVRDTSSKMQKLEVDSNEEKAMHPNTKCTLSASTTYPDTMLSSLELELMVNYSKDNGRYCSVYVGTKTMQISDLMSDTSMVSEELSKRDSRSNTAFDFVNYKDNFVLSSRVSSLLSLPATISKLFKCQQKTFGNVSVIKPTFFNSEIRITNASSLCDCTVYANSRKVIRTIVLELEKLLPADVDIKLRVDLIDCLVKKLYYLLKREIDVGVRYIEKQVSLIEEEYERDKQVIVIDSPKRKRPVAPQDEIPFGELYEAVLATDQCLLEAYAIL